MCPIQEELRQNWLGGVCCCCESETFPRRAPMTMAWAF